MDQKQGNQAEQSCSVCNQRFSSDRELQDHQQTAHAERGKQQPGSTRIDQPDQGDKQERVA